ncbi:PHD finger protein 12 [Chironomus tepperi]|uniref:PHD finger protein 12 n=1 Tax=Chironomus tepperi TaxID=113505 RepID=UPI00391F2BB3
MSRQKVQYGTGSDYSEGLMGEIQRLIAPPSEEYKKKPVNPFKRAGRSNHDTCDSCSEAGNLICCDYCAASFHLSCHDPPLVEEDICKRDLWLCHTCTMKEKYAKQDEEKQKEKEKLDAERDTKICDESTVQIADDRAVIEGEMQIECEIKTEEVINEEKEKSPEQDDNELSPFDELIRVASLLNPRQFELPVEMTQQFPFPGSERADHMKNGRRVKTKRLVELDSNGCVPLPAKLCFTCNKSCKKAPLISCDYCSLYFHQDCLDPPMCALPSGRWMCPAHPQQFIDWNLVETLSASERMKLWDRYAKDPVDHEVIKLQFFRKVHMKNPPFRIKLKPKRVDEIEIPEIVKYQYENPPDLLPSMRQVMRIENLKKRGTAPVDFQKSQLTEIDEQLDAMETARKKLKTIFSDQEDIHKILESSESEEEQDVEQSPSKSPPPKKSRKSKSDVKETGEGKEEGINLSITEVIQTSGNLKDTQNKQDPVIEIKIESDENIDNTKDTKKESLLTPLELQAINEQLCNLDMDTIKLLAFQRLQQIVNENPNNIQKFQSDKAIASQSIAEIAKWDAHRFPIPVPNDEIKKEIDTDNNPVTIRMRDRPFHIRSDEEKSSSLALSLEYPINRSKVKSRAVLTFANDYLSGRKWFTIKPNLNQSIFMKYRSFEIGIGANNNLDLSRFGTCAYTSPKHAVIFFDEITKQYELLNYSEFGTDVNGQIFSCDFTEHPTDISDSHSSPLKEKRVAIQSKIKNMIDAKKKIREGIDKSGHETDNDMIMAAEDSPYCQCKGRYPMIQAWEGTALLQHGYLLKFGCLSFVFSIVEDKVEIEP